MIETEKLKALSGNLEVLYVEDEPLIRETLGKQLTRLFKTVHVAEDGQAGLALYSTHRPPLVITDIRMPLMDGLEMAKAIKIVNPDALILVTTAHNDEAYFQKSIEIGIDGYLIKPIEMAALREKLYGALKRIEERNLAAAHRRKQEQEAINLAASDMAGTLMAAVPIPLVLMGGERPLYLNDAFCDLLGEERFESFKNGQIALDDLLIVKPGYLPTMELYRADKENKVYLRTAEGFRVFLVFKKQLRLHSGKEADLYSLIDVTLGEYQKIKLENYATRLADMLLRRQRGEAAPKPGKKASGHAPLLDSREEAFLRKSHTEKTAASAYVAELGDEVLEMLDELKETDRELAELIGALGERLSLGTLGQIGERLDHYARAIGQLFEFEGLAYGIGSLAAFLSDLKENELGSQNAYKLLSFLENIRLDLAAWRQMIFVDKQALDIHYLDSSLLSSALQAQLSIRGNGSDEGELELF